MYLLSVCDNVMFLKVMLFIRKLLDIIFFIVPMGLIVMVSVDFLKNVIASKEDDMKKNLGIVIKRFIYAVFLFLVPVIVNFVVNFLIPEKVEFEACFNVTQAQIDNKILEQEAKCVGDDYTWNDTIYICEKNKTYNPPIYNTETYVTNFSSTGSSGSSSGSSIGEINYYNQCAPMWKTQPYCTNSTTNDICHAGCGITSLAMVATALVDKKYDPSYVAKWMCENKIGGTTGTKGTDNADMISDKVKEHFNLNVEILFEGGNSRTYVEEQGKKILNAAHSNKMVVLNVPNHYTVVAASNECKNNEVYFYEVADITKNGCYTPEKLFEITYNRKKRCTNEGICGWKAAYAYTKK